MSISVSSLGAGIIVGVVLMVSLPSVVFAPAVTVTVTITLALSVSVPVAVTVAVAVAGTVQVALPVVVAAVAVREAVPGSDGLAVAAGGATVALESGSPTPRAGWRVGGRLSAKAAPAALISHPAARAKSTIPAEAALESSAAATEAAEPAAVAPGSRWGVEAAGSDRARWHRLGISTTTEAAAEPTRLPALDRATTFHIHYHAAILDSNTIRLLVGG